MTEVTLEKREENGKKGYRVDSKGRLPYYRVELSVPLDNVTPAGFPKDLDMWMLINTVYEREIGPPGAAGTGFGARDMAWYFDDDETKTSNGPYDETAARAAFAKAQKVTETMGFKNVKLELFHHVGDEMTVLDTAEWAQA